MKKIRSTSQIGWCRMVSGIALGISLVAVPAMSAEGIDPDADRILQSMSSYLGATKAFSMNADIDFEVVAKNGTIISKGIVTAESEWMTMDFVAFNGTLSYLKPSDGYKRTLIFQKDNPIDRLDLDDEVGIPVFFK